MESNEPYNPIPGLAAGAFIGGGMTGLAAFGGTTAVNGYRGMQNNRVNKQIGVRDQAIQSINEAKNNHLKILEEESLKNTGYAPGGRQPVQAFSPKQIQQLKDTANESISEHEKVKKELMNKKLKPKITGGRKAGIIGGTALVGSIIGGTAGVVGNYN